MAKDSSLALRQAVITALRADTILIGTGSPELDDRIYGMRTPAKLQWPFTRYGASDALPFRAQCLDGSEISFTVHSFSKAMFEDECAEINFAINSALDGVTLDLTEANYDASAHIRWVGSQIIADAAEANAWHGINRFAATVVS